MRAVFALVVLAVVIVGAIAAIVVGWPIASAALAQNDPPIRQPIAFPHAAHVKGAQIDCLFCHRGANQGAAATVPSAEQCMFCHRVVATGRPEVEKLRTAFAAQQPINWVRVYRLPDHTHFVHEPHIRAGFQCATCHGDVGSMREVRKVRPLNMGDCVTCHRQNNGPTDCAKCHY